MLRLTLKPHERAILGDAVIKNGVNRVSLYIENEVPILRESDILSPRAVHTPCERIYLAVQLLYVDAEHRENLLIIYRSLVDEVRDAAPSLGPLLAAIDGYVERQEWYQAVKSARPLLEREREILARVSQRSASLRSG
jgi:flagellar protein FlbT